MVRCFSLLYDAVVDDDECMLTSSFYFLQAEHHAVVSNTENVRFAICLPIAQ